MEEICLFRKEYCGESIVDIEGDIFDTLEVCDVECEDGIMTGTFRVRVEWIPDED